MLLLIIIYMQLKLIDNHDIITEIFNFMSIENKINVICILQTKNSAYNFIFSKILMDYVHDEKIQFGCYNAISNNSNIWHILFYLRINKVYEIKKDNSIHKLFYESHNNINIMKPPTL